MIFNDKIRFFIRLTKPKFDFASVLIYYTYFVNVTSEWKMCEHKTWMICYRIIARNMCVFVCSVYISYKNLRRLTTWRRFTGIRNRFEENYHWECGLRSHFVVLCWRWWPIQTNTCSMIWRSHWQNLNFLLWVHTLVEGGNGVLSFNYIDR